MSAFPQKWWLATGMRRSASTLQYLLTWELLRKKGTVTDVGFIYHNGFDEVYNTYKDTDGTVLLKSHAYLPMHSTELTSIVNHLQFRQVHIIRDIRDVMASLTRTDRRVREELSFFTSELHCIMMEHYSWQSTNDLCRVDMRYEDVVERLDWYISYLAHFVEVSLTDPEIVALAEKYSYENMERTHSDEAYERRKFFKHTVPFQGGKVGRWKDDLTERQKEIVASDGAKYLEEYGYE